MRCCVYKQLLHHNSDLDNYIHTLLLRRCLTKNSTVVIQLEVSRPVCMELYQDCRELGRFMLRSGGATIAAGVVTKVHVHVHGSVGE